MYSDRLTASQKLLTPSNLDACLITSVPAIIYLSGLSSFSIEEREAFLLITRDQQYILTDGRYTTAVENAKTHFELIEIGSSRPLKKVLDELFSKHAIKIIGIEEMDLHVHEYKTLIDFGLKTKPFSLSPLRIKKTKDELRAIELSCEIGDSAFDYIIKQVKPNMREKDLALLLESYIRKNADDISFKSIIGFGENGAMPHYQMGTKKLEQHELILMDFGVKINNYCSDMTRTVFFGKATVEQKKMYHTVYDAQQKAKEYIEKMLAAHRPVLANEADSVAREYIIANGYPSIPHSLGHGIGLEVHEPPTLSPVSNQTLVEGMVFSIEPGIYIPGKAGIRIEDLFAIVNNTLIQLTHAPANLIEL